MSWSFYKKKAHILATTTQFVTPAEYMCIHHSTTVKFVEMTIAAVAQTKEMEMLNRQHISVKVLKIQNICALLRIDIIMSNCVSSALKFTFLFKENSHSFSIFEPPLTLPMKQLEMEKRCFVKTAK